MSTAYLLIIKLDSGRRTPRGPASLISLMKYMRRSMHGGTCGILFLDLAKAFDTVGHRILKTKLRALGFKASTVSWFTSYLANHQQATKIGSVLSSTILISCRVPHGSILGPFFYVMLMIFRLFYYMPIAFSLQMMLLY